MSWFVNVRLWLGDKTLDFERKRSLLICPQRFETNGTPRLILLGNFKGVRHLQCPCSFYFLEGSDDCIGILKISKR